MSFLGLDLSRDSGAPVEFFEFVLGAESWRYTTAAEALVCEGQIYEPAIISKGAIELTGELKGRPLTVKVSGINPTALKYRVYVPASPMVLTIRKYHRSDSSDSIVVWTGVARAVAWNNTEAEFRCESTSMVIGRTGLFRFYQSMCGHIWGSWQCGVNVADYTEVATVSAFTDTVITCNHGQDEDYFRGGFVEHDDTDYRMITSSTTTSITVPFPFEGLATGANITLFAGCDRSHDQCVNKFDNGISYGGCLYVPTLNPFAVGVF